ncbi:uroporphyrinogen-III C-methyltransferase [Candidatus Profftia tarda]|uniref:Uroporphyrinogen-III C-methyltransferase n=1 Tax=Candidatus Profftia tarda TaxID=1177216 RepID=A0A8E4H4E8_9ENTR|nr:uroporphyrinogen-III C-methyltransferase [Candidatus Profftia tarda]CAD6513149.1 Putative uroporphyrinogen-III C-methyltransferase [Candidatus Profftia tarda]
MKEESPKKNKIGTTVTLALLIVIIALTSLMSYHTQKQDLDRNVKNNKISKQLTIMHQKQLRKNSFIKTLMNRQHKILNLPYHVKISLLRQYKNIQNKVVYFSASHQGHWLSEKSDFLIKISSYQPFKDQGIINVGNYLINSSDTLANMTDNRLFNLFLNMPQENSSLAILSSISFDAIIIKINQLSNQADQLRLAYTNRNKKLIEEKEVGMEVSDSINDWRQNLLKIWNQLLSDFLTVERRNNNELMLSLNHRIYLYENIRSKLLSAAQEVFLRQNIAYHQSIETVLKWVRDYCDMDDFNTKKFLSQLEELNQYSIEIGITAGVRDQA